MVAKIFRLGSNVDWLLSEQDKIKINKTKKGADRYLFITQVKIT